MALGMALGTALGVAIGDFYFFLNRSQICTLGAI